MIIDANTLFDLLRVVVNRSDEKIKRLADTLFQIYKDNVSEVSPGDTKYCELYIELCKEVIGNQLNITDHKFDITNLFKRHLMGQIYKRDSYVRESLKSVIETVMTPTRLSDTIKKLNNIVSWRASDKYIKQLYGQLRESNLSYSPDAQAQALDNVKTLVDEFKNTMLELDAVSCKGGPIEVIDMSDRNSIREAYRLYKERRVNHVLRTGLQGLNQMFGSSGGMALGESVLFAARTHHYKSGMLMKMVQWIAEHSTPPKTPGKVPMILVISLENEGYQNMMKLFENLYVACYKEKPPVGMSDEDMVEMIYSFFNKSDYVLVIERYLPSSFGYDELILLLTKYENAGFRIIATIIDYLTQMKTHNGGSASRSGDHTLLQELCNKVVNYFKAVGTTLLTATQLNRGASDIAASGIPHPVKHYSERHFAGSTGIAREFDFIAYLEIEKDEQGNAWLTIQWGKHRYVDDTDLRCKFVAYKFDPDLGIIDDINGPHMGSRNIYKKTDAKQASVSDINAILGLPA